MNDKFLRWQNLTIQKLSDIAIKCDEWEEEEIPKILKNIIQNQTDPYIKFILLGENGVGKSTVINKIIEKDILPTGILPTTKSITNLFVDIHEDSTYNDNDIFSKLENAVLPGKAINISICSNKFNQQIKLIDTPGCSYYSKGIAEYVETADILFFVLSSNRFITRTEEEFIKTTLKKSNAVLWQFVANLKNYDNLSTENINALKERARIKLGKLFCRKVETAIDYIDFHNDQNCFTYADLVNKFLHENRILELYKARLIRNMGDINLTDEKAKRLLESTRQEIEKLNIEFKESLTSNDEAANKMLLECEELIDFHFENKIFPSSQKLSHLNKKFPPKSSFTNLSRNSKKNIDKHIQIGLSVLLRELQKKSKINFQLVKLDSVNKSYKKIHKKSYYKKKYGFMHRFKRKQIMLESIQEFLIEAKKPVNIIIEYWYSQIETKYRENLELNREKLLHSNNIEEKKLESFESLIIDLLRILKEIQQKKIV